MDLDWRRLQFSCVGVYEGLSQVKLGLVRPKWQSGIEADTFCPNHKHLGRVELGWVFVCGDENPIGWARLEWGLLDQSVFHRLNRRNYGSKSLKQRKVNCSTNSLAPWSDYMPSREYPHGETSQARLSHLAIVLTTQTRLSTLIEPNHIWAHMAGILKSLR